jgi:6-pyruvoyltetrahydropterin/6-carboxytetrahydropterin synthase
VTVNATEPIDRYVDGVGIILDFKELKAIVQTHVVKLLDHKLLLSKAYIKEHNCDNLSDELVVFEVEPTAENMLIFARDQIRKALPEQVQLQSLKLWETRDSYAEWLA